LRPRCAERDPKAQSGLYIFLAHKNAFEIGELVNPGAPVKGNWQEHRGIDAEGVFAVLQGRFSTR